MYGSYLAYISSKKKKGRCPNRLYCIYLQNFLAAALNENFVRKYKESVMTHCGRAAVLDFLHAQNDVLRHTDAEIRMSQNLNPRSFGYFVPGIYKFFNNSFCFIHLRVFIVHKIIGCIIDFIVR